MNHVTQSPVHRHRALYDPIDAFRPRSRFDWAYCPIYGYTPDTAGWTQTCTRGPVQDGGPYSNYTPSDPYEGTGSSGLTVQGRHQHATTPREVRYCSGFENRLSIMFGVPGHFSPQATRTDLANVNKLGLRFFSSSALWLLTDNLSLKGLNS
ncbi:hypothetical protein J6590_029618 [Homalodisca vitripennis]|nr:hypothetical protein J6590_029618 [Homalodisca vitripennis]